MAFSQHANELDEDGNPIGDDETHGFRLDPVQTAKRQAKLEKRVGTWVATFRTECP